MNLLTALAEVGRILRDKAEAKVSEVNAPSAIVITTGSPMQTGAVSYIEVTAKHPAVLAFEYGSGIHATRGEKGLYPIKAKGADPLHFFWENRGKWFIGMELPFGHPGVAPRPFMKPAFDENKDEFRRIIGQGFKAEILAGQPKVIIEEIRIS